MGSKEKERLRASDPDLYEKANKLEAEQKQYEEDTQDNTAHRPKKKRKV